jgi:excinuclease ABC subunit A
MHHPLMSDPIVIHGARQNNLKNLTLELPTNELVVVTGVSGSGKSSLVFDTLYAEGQRRYVETFSPYARQFLDRMDKPQVDRIDGIPPAIAIDQTNPVRTSRSTVGTMTELADHLKVLYARASTLYCRGCGRAVTRDTPSSIHAELTRRSAAAGDPRLVMTFPVTVPANYSEAEVRALLEAQGYTRIQSRNGDRLSVVQDRFRMTGVDRARVMDAIEAALRVGKGRVDVHIADGTDDAAAATASPAWRFSSDLHCPDCDIHYRDPTPSLFSFNSPLGACETCRGFGRVIGLDYGLVVPDAAKTLRAGAVKPWQSPSFRECQDDLQKYAKKRGVPLDVPGASFPTTIGAGCSTASRSGRTGTNRGRASGTAPRDSSRGSKRSRTRCTFACCCRSIARTRPARRAAARGSSPMRCYGGSARKPTPIACSLQRCGFARMAFDSATTCSRSCPASRCTISRCCRSRRRRSSLRG